MQSLSSQRRGNPPLVVIGFALLCLLLGIGVAQNALLPLLLLCVSIATIGIALLPQAGLYVILIGMYSLDWLSRALGLLPTQMRWLPDVVLVALAIVVVLKVLLEGRTLRRTPIDAFLLALFIAGMASTLINESSPLVAVNGFRSMWKPLLLFYVAINLRLSPRTLKRLVVVLIGLELLQIPITIVQAQLFGAGDDVGGTLGFSATQIATITALMVMSLLFGLATVSRKGWLYGLAGSSLFIPILLGEGKLGFFLAPPMVLFILAQRTANRLRIALFATALFVIIYVVSLVALPVLAPKSQLADFLRSPALIFEIYERPLDVTGYPISRLSDIQFAAQLAGRSPLTFLLGYGPGEASPSFFGDLAGRLYGEYEYLGSVFGKTQISRALLEWGFVGILIYLVSVWRMYQINQRLLDRSDLGPFWQGIALGFRGVVLVFLASTVYWYVWQSDATAYVFWLLAAAVFVRFQSGAPVAITHVS